MERLGRLPCGARPGDGVTRKRLEKNRIFKRRFALQAAFVFWDYEAGRCARVYIKKTEGSR